MDNLYGVLETVLPIVVMLGFGILLKKLRAFTSEGMNTINDRCSPLPARDLFRTFAGITYT